MYNKNMDVSWKSKILKLEIASLVFCLVMSFVNHNLYEWTNGFRFIGPFVPVSESVWEHGKLLYMPFFFFGIFEYVIIGNNKNFLYAKSVPLALCTPLMILLFYTYSSLVGRHLLVVDILIAVVIIVLMHIFSYRALISPKKFKFSWSVAIAAVFFLMFIVFTFFAPPIIANF